MEKYFANEELNNLWSRLVSATQEITGFELSNAGLREINDKLTLHYGFSPNIDPLTPGDYLKNIAGFARYKQTESAEGAPINLETIVKYLELKPYSFELTEDLVLYCHGRIPEYATLVLYKDHSIVSYYERTNLEFPLYLQSTADSDWTSGTKPAFDSGWYYVSIYIRDDEVYKISNEVYFHVWVPEINGIYEEDSRFYFWFLDPGYMEEQPSYIYWSVEKSDGASVIFQTTTKEEELYKGDWYDSLEPGEYTLYVEANFDNYENATSSATFYK